MATTIDKIKLLVQNEILTETDLDNILCGYGFYPADNDDDDIIKYSNGKSQIWLDIVRDEFGNIITDNVRKVTKEEGETEVDPIHSFEDLKHILDYFYNKKQYHHWLNALLQSLLGRRVGDVTYLKWSDFYLRNGQPKEKLSITEQKTGKITKLLLTDYVMENVQRYSELVGIKPTDHYNERLFDIEAQSFRKALKSASNNLGIRYAVSCHSFRKFFGNQSYKLHPNDPDRIKKIQFLFGHASEQITRHYIGEIGQEMDKYMEDISTATKAYFEGNGYEVDNSPVMSFRTQDIRKMVSDIYIKGKQSALSGDGLNDMEIINGLISDMEKMRL